MLIKVLRILAGQGKRKQLFDWDLKMSHKLQVNVWTKKRLNTGVVEAKSSKLIFVVSYQRLFLNSWRSNALQKWNTVKYRLEIYLVWICCHFFKKKSKHKNKVIIILRHSDENLHIFRIKKLICNLWQL